MASTANSHARSDAAATGPIAAIGARDMAARWALAVVVIGAAANLLVQGFEFPAYNNMYHVPIVLDYAHSVEGPHDAFDQSLTNFTSLLWPLLSLVATERNVEALFFAVYALNRVALLVFLYLTARELLPGRTAPALALAVSVAVLLWWMAWPLSPLGGNDLFVRALSQTQLTVTALVACLWLMLRRRWLATAICLGIAFDVNAFMALWGGVIALVAYIYVHRAAPRGALLRNLAKLGAAAAVAALPTIVWIAWTVRSALPAPAFDYKQYIREFYPRHNLLEGNWSGVLIAAMVAAVVWSYIRDQRLFASARQREIVAASFAALCGIVLFGMAMPYLVDSRLLYCLFPLRMDGYLIAPLMIVLISVALARAHATADDGSFWSEALVLFAFANGNLPLALVAAQARPGARDRRSVAALLLLAAALVAISAEVPVYYRPGGMKALALVMCQAVVAVIALRAQRSRPAQAVVIAALIAPALAPAALATSLRIAIALVYFGAAVALVATGLAEPGRPREIARPATGAWPAAMLRAWAAPVVLMAALAGGALRVAAAGTINNLAPADRAEFEAQLWLRGHSPPDARVLPFDAEGFSVLSRRPVWVDGKVGSAVMWAPWYFSTWQTRLNEVSRLHDLRQTLDYAHAHDIAYIVMSRAAAARLGAGPATPGIVHTNPDYLILATDRTAPPAASAGRRRSP